MSGENQNNISLFERTGYIMIERHDVTCVTAGALIEIRFAQRTLSAMLCRCLMLP